MYFTKCDRPTYEKMVKAEIGQDAPSKAPRTIATYESYPVDNSFVRVIWLSENADITQLVHESFHLVHALLQDRGLFLTDQSEEAYAYLLHFVFDKMKGIVK